MWFLLRIIRRFVYNIKMSYNIVNSKLSKSQISKLHSAVKNGTDVTLRLSIKNFGENENDYPHISYC